MMLRRREQSVCPCCGQRVLIRLGVRLSPRLADIFDMIERSGLSGVASEVLIGVFYPDRPCEAARACLKSNISHLNVMLAETDFEVRASRYEPYRVVRRQIADRDRGAHSSREDAKCPSGLSSKPSRGANTLRQTFLNRISKSTSRKP